MSVEASFVQAQLIERNGPIGEMVGYSPEDLAANYQVSSIPLKPIKIDGHEPILNERFHVGPTDLTGGGGMKAKAYATPEDAQTDGFAHAAGMEPKEGVINEVDFKGAKSIINVNPRTLPEGAMAKILRGKAEGMFDVGLHLPELDKPAGDEGTNAHILSYVDRMRELGVAHPFATATGKPDMEPRAAATGRNAAIIMRTTMDIEGEKRATVALQGLGFAGGYFAGEAYEPQSETDRELQIVLQAVGDLDPNGRRKTLVTTNPDGLPITTEMMNSILLGGKYDDDVQAVGGNTLYAVARKLEHAGVDFELLDEDVLTFDKADYVVPAATSGVLTDDHIGAMEGYDKTPQIFEIGNNTLTARGRARRAATGIIRQHPSALVSAGGVGMSFEERRRDMARITAEQVGKVFAPEPNHVYEQRVRYRVVTATNQVHAMSELLGVNLNDAVIAVSLGNRAIARGIRIDQGVEDLLQPSNRTAVPVR